ncbi:MAG: hypothetical protein VB010_01870 [Sphaerochaeta associata]|uniref:hypothetical protein n=1 Tax=Sphaerochaeta associata TaxID=1129264 RepID=UPI002B203984|nr:hypothetical protein [Sphaerochaeta associata]MEA5106089.1 hypothetical protein [Sphaerochaeta associata]
MNRTSITSRWFLIPLIGLMCLMAGGCKEESATRSTLQLRMVSSEANDRSLLPKDTPLEVSRYAVEGEGPQGTTFSVMSTTQNLEVEGLLIGNWTITAIGQNSGGVDLVTGQATVTLSPEPSPVTIELDSLAGKGLLNIVLRWNAAHVSDPSLQVSLTDEANNTQILTPTTNNMAEGSVTYSGHYNAGSYLLNAQLFSGSAPVAGCAEVVRIVGNRTTEGVIELKLDKYANVPSGFTLINHLGVPVQCTITGISENVEALKPMTASISTVETGEIAVNWYLDGVLVGSALECTFTPASGTHRLDVIAKGALQASSGSASISFTATVNGETGVPILVSTVEDNTGGMHIGIDAHAAFLSDGKILLASNQAQTIQVCRIVRDSLEVVHTYTAADGFITSGITDVLVDHTSNRVIIADSTTPGLTFYEYNIATSSLNKLFTRNNSYGYVIPGDLRFPYLTDLTLLRSSGILYGLHPVEAHVVETKFYVNSQENLYTDYYYMKYPAYKHPYAGMAISDSATSSALTQKEGSLLRIFRKGSFSVPFTNPVEFTSANTPYLSNVEEVAFLNDNNLMYATDNDVGRFTYANSTWEQMEVYTSDLDGIGSMEGIVQLLTDALSNRLYVLTPDSLLTFNCPSPSYALSHVNTTVLPSYQASRMDVSKNRDMLLLTSESNASLLLFRIP